MKMKFSVLLFIYYLFATDYLPFRERAANEIFPSVKIDAFDIKIATIKSFQLKETFQGLVFKIFYSVINCEMK